MASTDSAMTATGRRIEAGLRSCKCGSTPGSSSVTTLSVTLFGREIKQVVLLHANMLNADHFVDLARMMRQRGYSFISLDAALRDDAYASADVYTGDESINWLARWAVTRGVKRSANVLDDFPDLPRFVR